MTNRASILSLLSLVLLYCVSCTTVSDSPSDTAASDSRSGVSTSTRSLKFPADKLIDPENCLISDDLFPPPDPIPDLSLTVGRWGKGFAMSMALSPDGTYLAIGTSIGIDVYYTDKLELVWSQPSGSIVTELKFSQDNKILVSMSEFVVAWDVQTGEQIQEIVRLPNSQMNFSADGSMLAITRGCTIFWDTQTWQPITAINGYAETVAFSPDDTLFVEGLAGGAAIIWDIKRGRQKYVFNENLYSGDAGVEVMDDTPIIQHIVFSPDGSRLALGSVVFWGNTTLSVLDTRSGDVVFSIAYDTNESGGVDFSPNGTQIAAVSSNWEGITTIWDIESGDELATLTQEPNALLLDVEWSPDGDTLFTVAGAYSGAWQHAITAWDARTYDISGTIEGYTGMILHVGWSPTGELIVIGPSDFPPILLDSDTLEPVQYLEDQYGDSAYSFRWSLDGSKIAARRQYQYAALWETTTGDQIQNFNRGYGSVVGLTYADRPMIIWETYTGRYEAVNLENGETLYTIPVSDKSRTSTFSWSEDGRLLAWQNSEDSILVWDAESHQSVTRLDFQGSYLRDLVYSPDGKLLAAQTDSSIIIWDVRTSDVYRRFPIGDADSFSLSPDGTRIAVGTESQRVVIWDIESREKLFEFTGHFNSVTGVAWSPDGKQLASVSIDGTLILWDVLE